VKMRNAIAVAIPVLFLGAFAMVSAQTNAGASDAVKAITQLENENVKASLANSRQFLQKNVSEDFVGGTSFGKWESKADMLKDTDNPANKVNSMSIRDLKVHAYGDTGIARYTMAYDDTYNGEHRARTVLCTNTWVRQAGGWQQVASHCSQKK
jgi:ketosteroid isomerase-like protein